MTASLSFFVAQGLIWASKYIWESLMNAYSSSFEDPKNWGIPLNFSPEKIDFINFFEAAFAPKCFVKQHIESDCFWKLVRHIVNYPLSFQFKLQWAFGHIYLFHDGVPYHIETSLLIYRPNQWTGFNMIGTSVMKVETIQRHC